MRDRLFLLLAMTFTEAVIARGIDKALFGDESLHAPKQSYLPKARLLRPPSGHPRNDGGEVGIASLVSIICTGAKV